MLTSKELINVGIKPGELFGKILKTCSTLQEALEVWNGREIKERVDSKIMKEFTVWEWLCNSEFTKVCSREKPGEPASNSEKRRWLVNKSVRVNGEFPEPDDVMGWTITDLVFFPTSANRITMV